MWLKDNLRDHLQHPLIRYHQGIWKKFIRRNDIRMPRFTRRQFIQGLSIGAAGICAKSMAFGSKSLVTVVPAFAGPSIPPPLFEEVPSSTSGITWRHVNGRSPEYYLPETTGAGCAFLDYDNDGWMDIYLVNSGACDFLQPNPSLRNALYRNNRDGTFTDVTERAGVAGGGYGMGAAVGDYNGDGWPDLYLTQYGRSILYRNNKDGTFTDVTDKAGVAAPGWASSAVWFDYALAETAKAKKQRVSNNTKLLECAIFADMALPRRPILM